jgi:hypothetical protein
MTAKQYTESNLTKADVVRAVAPSIPLNSYGLPQGFFRTDLLPTDHSVLRRKLHVYHDAGANTNANANDPDALQLPTSVDKQPTSQGKFDELDTPEQSAIDDVVNLNDLQGAPVPANVTIEGSNELEIFVPHHILRAAFVPLDYLDGSPITPDGFPFWEQLSFEAHEQFLAFSIYLEQGSMGARQIHKIIDNPGYRQIKQLPTGILPKEVQKELVAELMDWYVVYYWGARSRAYDIFFHAHQRKSRQMQAMSIENSHLNQANRLYQKLDIYLHSDLFWQNLNPRTAIETLKMVVQMQRISVGLNANGPSTAGATGAKAANHAGLDGSESMETIVRKLASGALIDQQTGSPTGMDDEVRKIMLESPESAELFQTLIVRTTEATIIKKTP